MKERTVQPVRDALFSVSGLLAPALLLAVLGCTAGKGAGAARFAAQLSLLAGLMEASMPVLEAAEKCLEMVCSFAEAMVPAMAGLFTAAGMSHSATLLSPAAALVGNIAEEYFLRLGLPLCRCTLAVAVAGNLSSGIDLSRLFRSMRKIASWGVGLSFTLFTAIAALQGSMSASLDSIAVRTAKFAVDSASPLIGNGISDAWESYICGIRVARSAIGVSGIVALLLAAAQPVLSMLASLLALHGLSVFLDIFGEKQAARAAEQAAGVCQMAVELATGGAAIAIILLGAAMSTGQSLMG